MQAVLKKWNCQSVKRIFGTRKPHGNPGKEKRSNWDRIGSYRYSATIDGIIKWNLRWGGEESEEPETD